jgi:ABC-type polysaccharide/polyol phosphate transport system ATPase subunit
MSDIAIKVEKLGKMYRIYDRPADRLKQMLWGRWQAKPYGREFWAVRDITLTVRRGETLGIIGRNGCGKSTTLQMIVGILMPTHGTVETYGRVTALLELGSGFNNEYTGRENIFLYGSILGLSETDIAARFEKIVSFAEIGNFIEQPLKTYSSGMAVRLAFSCAIHVDPDILIIDEALSVGDVRFQQKCLRAIESLRKSAAVLLVTHDTSALKQFCHTAMWIDKGEIRMIGPSDRVATAYLDDCHGTRNSSPVATTMAASRKPTVFDLPRIPLGATDKGLKTAIITHAGFLDDNGCLVHNPEPGALANYYVTVCNLGHEGPIIIGLTMTDRLGQEIFAINSLWAEGSPGLMGPLPEQSATYRLRFTMPPLNHGNYCVAPAVATGSQQHHEILHWIHDATLMQVDKTPARCLPGALSLSTYQAEKVA